MNWTFYSAADLDDAYNEFVRQSGFTPPVNVSGSVDPADRLARLHTPVELRWERAVKFDHDFVGRAALEEEVANPRRRVVTLAWNPEDVVDIYASLLQPGEEYKTIDLPTSPPWSEGMNAHADHVLKDGAPVGVSGGTIYSYFHRQVLSHGVLDVDRIEHRQRGRRAMGRPRRAHQGRPRHGRALPLPPGGPQRPGRHGGARDDRDLTQGSDRGAHGRGRRGLSGARLVLGHEAREVVAG